MPFQCWLLLPLLHFTIGHSSQKEIEFYKLSNEESKEEFNKDSINIDATYDQLKPGAIILPLQYTTTVDKICSDDQLEVFKSGIVCFDGVRSRITVTVKVGEKDASDVDLFSVLLIVDTGSSVTWVWTEKTQFNLVINDTSNQVQSNTFYTGRLGPLPNYIPNTTDKYDRDNLTYSGTTVIEFDYYRNQIIRIPQQLGRVNMDMALVTNYTTPNVARQDTAGLLALGPLPRAKNPDNYFMGRFIQQKPPDLEGIFSIDIIIEDGIKKDNSHIGIGTSLRQLTSNAATVQVYGPIAQHKHWQIEVETLKITFPNKRPWIKNKIHGVFDTGTERFLIPEKYFNEIKKTHRVDNASLYEQFTVMNCSEIYQYLPEIEMDFRDIQTCTTNTIKIDNDKIFERFLSPYTNTERCIIQFKVQYFDPDLFIFGVPVFAASYIEFNYETKTVTIDSKNLSVP